MICRSYCIQVVWKNSDVKRFQRVSWAALIPHRSPCTKTACRCQPMMPSARPVLKNFLGHWLESIVVLMVQGSAKVSQLQEKGRLQRDMATGLWSKAEEKSSNVQGIHTHIWERYILRYIYIYKHTVCISLQYMSTYITPIYPEDWAVLSPRFGAYVRPWPVTRWGADRGGCRLCVFFLGRFGMGHPGWISSCLDVN